MADLLQALTSHQAQRPTSEREPAGRLTAVTGGRFSGAGRRLKHATGLILYVLAAVAVGSAGLLVAYGALWGYSPLSLTASVLFTFAGVIAGLLVAVGAVLRLRD